MVFPSVRNLKKRKQFRRAPSDDGNLSRVIQSYLHCEIRIWLLFLILVLSRTNRIRKDQEVPVREQRLETHILSSCPRLDLGAYFCGVCASIIFYGSLTGPDIVSDQYACVEIIFSEQTGRIRQLRTAALGLSLSDLVVDYFFFEPCWANTEECKRTDTTFILAVILSLLAHEVSPKAQSNPEM